MTDENKRMPQYGVEIYTIKDRPDVYRIAVGPEGSEILYEGKLGEIVDSSPLLTPNEVFDWLKERTPELSRKGEVVADRNFNFNFHLAMAQAAREQRSRS